MTLTLADLKPGQTARVIGFGDGGTILGRLVALGLLEGTDVQLVRRAPAGDPLEIRLLGYSLSLRKQEAQLVRVTLDPAPLASHSANTSDAARESGSEAAKSQGTPSRTNTSLDDERPTDPPSAGSHTE